MICDPDYPCSYHPSIYRQVRASTCTPFSIQHLHLRWESNSSPDTTTALLIRKGEGIRSSTGSSSEWILLNIFLAAVAELLLPTFGSAESSISYYHTEAL